MDTRFQDALIPIWNLFEKNFSGEIGAKQFKKYLALIYKIHVHYLEQEHLEKLAEDDCLRVTCCETSTINYDSFVEILANFVFRWLENINVQSAIGYIQMIFERTTKLVLNSVEDGVKEQEISYDISVLLYDRKQVEEFFSEKQQEELYPSIIYYEEKIIRSPQLLEQAKIDPHKTLSRKIAEASQIIPLGFSCESVLSELRNNNFEGKDYYTHIPKTSIKGIDKVKIVATLNDQVIDKFRVIVNEINNVIFMVIPVISDHLPAQSSFLSSGLQIFRINSYISRPIYFQELKNKKGMSRFFNILSDFYTNEDFQINEIDLLHKKWDEKNARKSQIIAHDGDYKTRFQKKQPKDLSEIARSLVFSLLKSVQTFCIPQQRKSALQEMQSLAQSQIQVQDSKLKLKDFVSKYKNLPYDTFNPYQDDIIEYANRRPLQILLLGKPKTGKTSFCKLLSKRIDIEFIDLEGAIERLYKKVKDFEENPQQDEEGNPKEYLTPTEKNILTTLQQGGAVAPQDLLELVNQWMKLDIVSNKGFILDLPLAFSGLNQQAFCWVEAIISGKLWLPRIQCRYFSHIIEFETSDEEVKAFARGLMEKPDDGKLYSQFDRDLLRKPKPKPAEGEEEEEPPPEEEEAKQPVDEKDLVFRLNEVEEIIDEALINYNQRVKKRILEFHTHLTCNEHIVVRSAGLNALEITDTVVIRLGEEVNPLRPLAFKLEGGAEKDQLTYSASEDVKPSRLWSPWQQIDPVELANKGRVVPGKGELACEYAGRVLLFENEENQNQFIANPRKFLQKAPELPKTYNVAIIGPRRTGKNTYADLICKTYGWQLVDIEKIVCNKLVEQRSWEQPKPSTFDPRVNDIHLSDGEWKDFLKGKEVVSKDVWPIVLHSLGIPLQKKPENWGIEKKEGEEGEDEEEKKRKEEEEQKKKNAKKAPPPKKPTAQQQQKGGNDEDERPKTPPPEDLPLKEIIQQVQEDNKIKPVRGLVIIGQPISEEQVNILKYHNIPLDKIIVLLDKEEENPGQILMKRPGFEEQYSLENENTIFGTAVGVLKEQYGEENVKEISINGSIHEVFNRIRTQLDPFFIKFDDDNMVRAAADVNEEEEIPISMSEYGPFCPITFRDEGWLLIGKKDFEAQVRQKRYSFFGEKEMQKFKEHVPDYVDVSSVAEGVQLKVPPPRIWVMGVRGSGVHTQLKKLHEQFKMPVLDFKKNLLELLEYEKQRRKQDRIFLKGFKPPEFDEEGKPIVVEDPEINDDPADFEKKPHEIDMTRQIFKNAKDLLINGNFFDVEEDKVQTPIVELLAEARRLPEVVIGMKLSDNDSYLKRIFNVKEIEDEYNKIIADRKAQKEKDREEARKARQKELEDGGATPEEVAAAMQAELQQQQEQGEEEDPDAPKLEDMINERKEKLMQAREAQTQKIDDMKTALEELGVPVFILEANRSIDNIYSQITFNLKKFLQLRENRLETFQCIKLKRPGPKREDDQPLTLEEAEADKVKLEKLLAQSEKSYYFRKSRYGDRNPISIVDVPKVRDFPLLYRNRIFYCSSDEELDAIQQEPLKYIGQSVFPLDFKAKPIIFVIGKSHSSKSSLAKLLEAKLGVVRIKVSSILEDFAVEHLSNLTRDARALLQDGQVLSDQTIVQLIKMRSQLADCQERGWVLDGFPQTRAQAMALTSNGIIPYCVLSMQLNDLTIKQRSKKAVQQLQQQKIQKPAKFGYNPIILHKKLEQEATEISALEIYYVQNYNNLKFLDCNISKWGLFDQARAVINSAIMQRQTLCRSLITDEPVCVGNLSLTPVEIINNLSQFKNYSPVSLKTNREFVLSSLFSNQNLVYFDKHIYVLHSEQEALDFVNRPDLYVFQKLTKVDVPHRIVLDNVFSNQEIVTHKGFCIGELLSNKLQPSQPDLLVDYKGTIYSFSSSKHMIKFLENPTLYMNVKLHDKLPVTFSAKNLVKKVAKKGNCTAFLEHHLGNIVMRVLAQLGYKRLKYPTINCKETALKFIAISLKACNPNKDESYRQKYKQKLQLFLKNCAFAGEIKDEYQRKMDAQQKQGEWNHCDEENLLKVTQEFADFMKELSSSSEKETYFERFIR